MLLCLDLHKIVGVPKANLSEYSMNIWDCIDGILLMKFRPVWLLVQWMKKLGEGHSLTPLWWVVDFDLQEEEN